MPDLLCETKEDLFQRLGEDPSPRQKLRRELYPGEVAQEIGMGW